MPEGRILWQRTLYVELIESMTEQNTSLVEQTAIAADGFQGNSTGLWRSMQVFRME